MNAPRPSLLDKAFKYVPASKTNIAATFARIRREQKQATQDNVRPLVPKAKR